MAASSSVQHRDAIVYQSDSNSDEFSAGELDNHNHHPYQQIRPEKFQQQILHLPTAARIYYQQTAAAFSPSSSRGDDNISSSSDEVSYFSDSDDMADCWDPYLYRLQLQAPKPNCIPYLKRERLLDRPAYYESEYHGNISREETSVLLGERDGNFLVRKGLSQSGTFSLSFVFENQVRHYKLYYEDGCHYVGEKPFDTIEDLVQDGLIILYMEANHVEEYLQSARESQLTKRVSMPHPIGLSPSLPDPTHMQENHAQSKKGEDHVFQTDDELCQVANEKEKVEEISTKTKIERYRRLIYQPCTIPLRRDCTNLLPPLDAGREGDLAAEDKISNHMPVPDSRERKSSMLHYSYEKPHNFKLHNYLGISWCDYCKNFMWGLRNQGFKCKDCGYNSHKQCKDETARDCQPSHQHIKKVFGVDLTTLVTLEGHKVPTVVRDCIEEVEKRGLDVEGIYRMSGKKMDILRLKCKFDTDMCADLSKIDDIHAITGTMKLYLRELPIPLLTFDSYDLCLIASRSSSVCESLDMLRKALARLLPSHYNTLKYLMRHLHQEATVSFKDLVTVLHRRTPKQPMVQLQASENRMDAKNLALVFTPTLMRSPHLGAEITAVLRLPEERKSMELLIQHFETMFT